MNEITIKEMLLSAFAGLIVGTILGFIW